MQHRNSKVFTTTLQKEYLQEIVTEKYYYCSVEYILKATKMITTTTIQFTLTLFNIIFKEYHNIFLYMF